MPHADTHTPQTLTTRHTRTITTNTDTAIATYQAHATTAASITHVIESAASQHHHTAITHTSHALSRSTHRSTHICTQAEATGYVAGGAERNWLL